MPVIVGPTAGGKSSLAIAIALRLRDRLGIGGAGGAGGEVISADAIQVYRGLDIGSGKVTPDEACGVPHHLLDIRDPTERFSAEEWLTLAEHCISEIRARGNVPIVVGGTHFYVKALLEGLFDGPGSDEILRAELGALDPRARFEELRRVDPAAAERIHPNDAKRVVRALEVFRLTGKPISSLQRQWDADAARSDAMLVGLEWPTDLINRRINARVRDMVERGFVEEVRGLLARQALGPTAREALGYKQIAAALERGGSRADIEEAIERTKIETRRFAKNQRTWLRRLRTIPGSFWIDAQATPPDASPEHWADLVIERLASDVQHAPGNSPPT
jgi:tRNA dimethylallyltransferase